ncbi:MAG: hypothetical protein WBG42_09595 [Cryomorphaceae bacterium]
MADLKPWMLLPPIIAFLIGIFVKWLHTIYFGFKNLRPKSGKFEVQRKSGKPFPHMKEIEISWNFSKPLELSFRSIHNKKMEGVRSSGTIYFKDKQFGSGFYKGEQSNYYGLANLVLFSNDEIGYYRTYVKDEEDKPHMVTTSKEITSQFMLKRKF